MDTVLKRLWGPIQALDLLLGLECRCLDVSDGALVRCQGVLCRYLAILEQCADHLIALVVFLGLEHVTDFEDLILHMLILLVVQYEPWLDGRYLCLEKTESVGICDFYPRIDIYGKLFVRFSKLILTVSVRAVLTKMTLLLLFKVLADLSLVVVVRYVEHLILNFNGQLLDKIIQCLDPILVFTIKIV